MVQLQFGVTQLVEAQVHPPTMAIPKFIQLILPLPPLSTMVQSRLGVAQVREAQVHLPTVAIPKFIQMMKAELVE
jgi:hypothetical protein